MNEPKYYLTLNVSTKNITMSNVSYKCNYHNMFVL